MPADSICVLCRWIHPGDRPRHPRTQDPAWHQQSPSCPTRAGNAGRGFATTGNALLQSV